MKIFSLQSKTGLVVWSAVLGLIIGILDNFFISYSLCNPVASSSLGELTANGYNCMEGLRAYGYPFVSHITSTVVGFVDFGLTQSHHLNDFLNILFWILVVFIILFISRYFKKKNNQITLKV